MDAKNSSHLSKIINAACNETTSFERLSMHIEKLLINQKKKLLHVIQQHPLNVSV